MWRVGGWEAVGLGVGKVIGQQDRLYRQEGKTVGRNCMGKLTRDLGISRYTYVISYLYQSKHLLSYYPYIFDKRM